MTKLEKKREELTDAYYKEQCEVGELNSRHLDSTDQAFAKGFSAALAELMPQVQKLVKACETTAVMDNECGRWCRRALTEWREYVGKE